MIGVRGHAAQVANMDAGASRALFFVKSRIDAVWGVEESGFPKTTLLLFDETKKV